MDKRTETMSFADLRKTIKAHGFTVKSRLWDFGGFGYGRMRAFDIVKDGQTVAWPRLRPGEVEAWREECKKFEASFKWLIDILKVTRIVDEKASYPELPDGIVHCVCNIFGREYLEQAA